MHHGLTGSRDLGRRLSDDLQIYETGKPCRRNEASWTVPALYMKLLGRALVSQKDMRRC